MGGPGPRLCDRPCPSAPTSLDAPEEPLRMASRGSPRPGKFCPRMRSLTTGEPELALGSGAQAAGGGSALASHTPGGLSVFVS